MRGNKSITETVALPSNGDKLDQCLANLVEASRASRNNAPISRGHQLCVSRPADYPTDYWRLGKFAWISRWVALGPMLEEKFGIPVFINNDGDLFVYGEAIGGFLPYINGLLKRLAARSNSTTCLA